MATPLEGVRVGIDDCSSSVAKKVREAKQDWVAYVVLVGEREATRKALQVYDRAGDTDREMTFQGLEPEIGRRIAGMPFRPRYFPQNLRARPEF